MPKPKHLSLLHREMTRKEFLAFGALAAISVFGFIGVIEELLSHAATPYAEGQASSGTRSGTTSLITTTGSANSQVVEFGTASTGGGGGTTPAYPPPGGVGALIFNSDFSKMANASQSAGPYFGKLANGVKANNGVTNSWDNINIVNGQLVLTLSSSTVGAQVSTDDGTNWPAPPNGAFAFTYGYVECSFIVPTGNWWAIWPDRPSNWPNGGEFDICENGGSGAQIQTNYHSGTGSVNGGDWSPQPAVGSTIVAGGLWKPGVVTSYQNGSLMKTLATGDGGITISDQPQCLVMNIGVYQGPIPAYLKVNWIRVWDLP